MRGEGMVCQTTGRRHYVYFCIFQGKCQDCQDLKRQLHSGLIWSLLENKTETDLQKPGRRETASSKIIKGKLTRKRARGRVDQIKDRLTVIETKFPHVPVAK